MDKKKPDSNKQNLASEEGDEKLIIALKTLSNIKFPVYMKSNKEQVFL